MKKDLVSVLVLNYNGMEYVEELFESLLEVKYPNLEILFIDNNSKDKSVEIVEKKYSDIKIIKLQKNYGFAKGNDIGLKYANGEYIVLLNNDTVVDKNWITELVEMAKKSEKFGIIVSKMYYYNNKNMINYAGAGCDKFLNIYHIGMRKKDHDILNIPMKTFYACGASLLIKRSLIEEIGLFDPNYFMYAEDLDFSWRVWLSGYKVVYCPKSFIYHKISKKNEEFDSKKFFFAEKHRLRTILKNYQIKSLIWILPVYLFIRLGMIIRNIIKKKLKINYFYKFLYALFWNLRNIKKILKYRKFISSIRVKDDKFIFGLMNKCSQLNEYVNKNFS